MWLDEQTGEVLRSRLIPAHEQVTGWLRSLPGPVKVAHEAGPTGFGLVLPAAPVLEAGDPHSHPAVLH